MCVLFPFSISWFDCQLSIQTCTLYIVQIDSLKIDLFYKVFCINISISTQLICTIWLQIETSVSHQWSRKDKQKHRYNVKEILTSCVLIWIQFKWFKGNLHCEKIYCQLSAILYTSSKHCFLANWISVHATRAIKMYRIQTINFDWILIKMCFRHLTKTIWNIYRYVFTKLQNYTMKTTFYVTLAYFDSKQLSLKKFCDSIDYYSLLLLDDSNWMLYVFEKKKMDCSLELRVERHWCLVG